MVLATHYLSADAPTAMASSRMGQMEETSLKAIQQAKRRRITTWLAVGSAGILVVAAVVISNKQRTNAKVLALEFLTLEQSRTTETEAYQDAMKKPGANPDQVPDYSKSTALFAEFAKQHPSNPLGIQAAFLASTEFLNSKQPKKAQELLENLTKQTLSNTLLQAKVRKTLSGIYAESKAFDKALKELDFIEKLPDVPASADIKLMRGKFTYLSGNKIEATKILKELANSGNTEIGANTSATEASLWLGYWGL